MAASRKKQDEKNLKTLRELVTLQHNKYCFDCNQRGPTYVNVTIGSFVCTKCSGMLRGLTPPHRVKSISMATFTTEEIDLVKSRGNDYCHRVWLGLYEGTPPSDSRDEQVIRDFMVDKYERKRYYLEPSQALQNGYKPPTNGKVPQSTVKPLSGLVPDAKPLRVNGTGREIARRRGDEVKTDFVADFASADIFSGFNNNGSGQTTGFANFDNNPVFTNKSMPSSSSSSSSLFNNNNNNNNLPSDQKTNVVTSQAPSEDRYAALKDLDNALKSQPTLDWNSSGSNSSLYSSSTTAGSMYSSPSPQGSMFGSPSQGQFAPAFSSQESAFSNPFSSSNGASIWGNNNGNAVNSVRPGNPFRSGDAQKMNSSFNYAFQPAVNPLPVNGQTWTPNPFKLGATSNGGNSSNPFL